MWGAYALALLAGVAMTVQSLVNGQLSVRLGSGIAAATLSFAGGLLVLTVIVAFSSRARTGLRGIRQAISSRSTPATFTLAGTAGAAFVFSQGAVSPLLGLSLFTVAFVSGVTAGGLFMDWLGVGPSGRRAISPLRLVGAFLGVIAVVVAVSGTLTFDRMSLLAILPLLCGVAVSWQQAANGRLTQVSGNPWSTTLVNFAVGFGVLMIGVAASTPFTARLNELPHEAWLYLGGPVGIVFIAIASIVVRYIGILVYGLCATTGQLLSALALDVAGLHNRQLSVSVLIGVVLVAIGAGLASVPVSRGTRVRGQSERSNSA